MIFDSETADAKLTFERTVERSLVHRAAVAEVFVTDLRGIDTDRYLAAAQLPLSHGYYSDHRRRPAVFDTLLLLEACRQASIYGAHQELGVPVDTTMMVSGWSIRLSAGPPAGPAPGELGLLDTTRAVRSRGGDIRSIRFDLELRLARRRVGTAHIEVSCVTPGQYAALRHMQRGDNPSSTTDLASAQTGDSLSPEQVGRSNPANVVIADPVYEAGALSARLAPRFDNPSLFDHGYDHYPAMVLMEAARQLSLLSADDGTGTVARHAVATGFDAGFERFAELDAPVFVQTVPAGDANRTAPAGDHPATEVAFVQREKTIARCAVTLADTKGVAA
jgi:2-oxo-3-(phosphooxy)propyl 3-oxoalkanoate synthase